MHRVLLFSEFDVIEIPPLLRSLEAGSTRSDFFPVHWPEAKWLCPKKLLVSHICFAIKLLLHGLCIRKERSNKLLVSHICIAIKLL